MTKWHCCKYIDCCFVTEDREQMGKRKKHFSWSDGNDQGPKMKIQLAMRVEGKRQGLLRAKIPT